MNRRQEGKPKRTETGLEPRVAGGEVSNIGGLSLADRQEPESIFASQFADMASFMEDMLEEEKRKRAVPKGPTQGNPRDSHDKTISRDPKTTSDTPTFNSAARLGSRHNGAPSGQGSGLAGSRWNAAEVATPRTADNVGGMAQSSEEPRASGTVANAGAQGVEAGKNVSPLPAGQSWW